MKVILREVLRREFISEIRERIDRIDRIDRIKHQVNGIEDHLEKRTFDGIFEHRVETDRLLDELRKLIIDEIEIC